MFFLIIMVYSQNYLEKNHIIRKGLYGICQIKDLNYFFQQIVLEFLHLLNLGIMVDLIKLNC